MLNKYENGKDKIESPTCFPSIKWTQILETIEELIFDLKEDNGDEIVEKITNLVKYDILPSFNMIICQFIYSAFQSHKKDFQIFLNFIQKIENKEEDNKGCAIIYTFSQFLFELDTQESYFLLEKMIELNLINSNLVENKKTFYFAHCLSSKRLDFLKNNIRIPFYIYFIKNIEKLSKNNWELHKQLIHEGVNPLEIAKIIRNDEIDKLQEISSQNDFDFDQIIEPSLYERCSFINKKKCYIN